MTDYIKKEDAIELAMDSYADLACEGDNHSFVEELKSIASADVAPVVRCKDCKWRNWETNGCDRHPCVEPWFEKDFCSYGERRGEEKMDEDEDPPAYDWRDDQEDYDRWGDGDEWN